MPVPTGDPRRYAAVDVHYPASGGAVGALVVADDPALAVLVEERTCRLDVVEPYVPGAFWRRELPVVRRLLEGTAPVDVLVVDGFATLDPDGAPGLGARVREALDVPVVIGVAKTAFRTATHAVPVLRGGATRPLFVTAVGADDADAAAVVAAMAGRHRLPDALRRVDRLCRAGGDPTARTGVGVRGCPSATGPGEDR